MVEVDPEDGIYEQETLVPLGASISELEHEVKIAEIETVNEKTSEVQHGELKQKLWKRTRNVLTLFFATRKKRFQSTEVMLG